MTTRLPVKLSNHQAIAHNYYTDQHRKYYNSKRSVRLQQHIIHVYMGDVWGTRVPIRLNCQHIIDKMDSNICFEMSFFVVEAIRGRCASFVILTATASHTYVVDRQM